MIVNPHQHLDLGNFFVEVDGLEIATDLGADNYRYTSFLLFFILLRLICGL